MTQRGSICVLNYTLHSEPALGGYVASFDGVSLTEITDVSLVSGAVPIGGEAAAVEVLFDALNLALPDVGRSVLDSDGEMRLLRLAIDQLLFLSDAPLAESQICKALEGHLYTTVQTDGWVFLEISGPKTQQALERICPLDLHPDVFGIDVIARTSMEHLGAVICRTGEDKFALLSASSSSHSFLHAIEVSIRNVT